MTKSQYAKCEEYSKELKDLPEYDTIVKASQLMSDGSYWGPEAEESLSPADINIDALKIQMKMFLKQYGEDVDPKDVSSDSFKDLVDRVMKQKSGEQMNIQNEVNESLVDYADGIE